MKAFFKKVSLFFTFIFVLTGLFNFYQPTAVNAYSPQDNQSELTNELDKANNDARVEAAEVKSEIPNELDKVVGYIAQHNSLPGNYITKTQAMKLGWDFGKDLCEYAPGKKFGGNIFYNFEGLLPESYGRIWRECDISCSNNSRGTERIVFSNDGLIYKTTDHYKSFICCNSKEKLSIN